MKEERKGQNNSSEIKRKKRKPIKVIISEVQLKNLVQNLRIDSNARTTIKD